MSDLINKEKAYWQGLAAPADLTLSGSDYQLAYLTAQGGTPKTGIDDMMNQLYGGDRAYWTTIAGSPANSQTLSISDLKRLVLG